MVITITNSNTNTNSCTSKNVNGDNEGFTWERFASLKTRGYPLKSYLQHHTAISVQGNFVFTGKIDPLGFGMVFVHDIAKANWTLNIDEHDEPSSETL